MSNTPPAAKPVRVQLEIPCSPEFVSVTRRAVEGICSRVPLSPREAGDVVLAVGEACTNAVKFSCRESGSIKLTCVIKPDKMEFTVRNRGEAFGSDRKYPVMPPTEDLDRGGMGLYLISRVMDDLKVTSCGGTTTLRMVKKFGK